MPFDFNGSFEKASVLLGIEHAASAELLADRLRRRQVHVCHVENGEAVAERLQERSFGALVVQPRLPGRTGLELLRSLPPMDPPLVMLGRKGNDAVIVRAFELGAADFITRPFSPNVATARILRLLVRSTRPFPKPPRG